jgi:hypothetical protein
MAMLGSDVLPTTNKQYIFAIGLAMVGIVVFSTVIGSLSAVITEMDALDSAKHEQVGRLQVQSV